MPKKNILECLKEADKRNGLSDYYGYTYCIYKENKPKKEITEREENGEKIVKMRVIPGEAMLLEIITVNENGVTIRWCGYLAQAGKAAQEFDSPAGHNRQYCRENY